MNRIEELDGLRGIAILMVVVWHYLPCAVVLDEGEWLSYAVHLLDLTWSGVDLFFVLSGFLIGGILLDNLPSAQSLRAFYIRRACRILPLYFVLVVSFYVFRSSGWFASPAFEWLFGNPLPWWSYATLTQNFIMDGSTQFGPHWLGVTWSLCVEEQFYILLPFVIYFAGAHNIGWICAAGLLIAPLLRFVDGGFHAFVSTPWRADSVSMGVLLALMCRKPEFLDLVRRRAWVLKMLFGVFLVGAAWMTVKPLAFGSVIFNIGKHTWLALLYGSLVLIAASGVSQRISALLRWRVFAWLGGISYGIYLFHEIANGLLHGFLFQSAPRISTWWQFLTSAAAFVVTLVVAWLSYRVFERPFLRLGHRFNYEKRVETG